MTTSLANWLERLERRHPTSIDLGLDRCGAVYARMGAKRPARRVITVAGTNGKGSTVAWLEALCLEAGRRVACYTSPHILEFNERLRINGQPVQDQTLVDAFEAVEAARDGVSLTYFEFTTLACLTIMSNQGGGQGDGQAVEESLDYAILEVGLGGRLDTVNLVDADLAIILPIGLDHQQFLGDDRETIGAEKAAVLRAGRPVVCAEPEPPASVLSHAQAIGAPLCLAGRDFKVLHEADALRLELGDLELHLSIPQGLPIPGAHQAGNLSAALAALNILEPEILDDPVLVERGVARARLPGRLMRMEADERLLLDVGHNPMAALAVARHLADVGSAGVACVLAMLRDKDAGAVVDALAGVVRHWYCAGLGGDRGQSGQALAQKLGQALPAAECTVRIDVAQALESARAGSATDQTILVFGSFQTVAAALRALRG